MLSSFFIILISPLSLTVIRNTSDICMCRSRSFPSIHSSLTPAARMLALSGFVSIIRAFEIFGLSLCFKKDSLPFCSSMAYLTSPISAIPCILISVRTSLIDILFSFNAFCFKLPLYIIYTGSPSTIRFTASDLFFQNDIITSAEAINRIGIIEGIRGMSLSLIGRAPISEIKRVVISSLTSNSPICLLPMILSIMLKIIYIIIVLMNIEIMKITPVFSYFTESEKNPKKTKKSLKKVLTRDE